MRTTSVCVLAIVATLGPAFRPLHAQIQAVARLDGDILPVVSFAHDRIYVLKDGKRREAKNSGYEIRPAPSFGEGFVTISGVDANLDPLRDASPEERAKPSAIRFRYRASIESDRPLANCFAVLTFVTEGSVGTRLLAVGNLEPAKAARIELELLDHIEAVGSLHVFSNALEIKSNQQPVPYAAADYLAGLARGARGIPAAALVKSADTFEHKLSSDGRMLATVRRRDAKLVLIVYDLVAMKPLWQLPLVNANQRLANLYWVSDHELAFIADEPTVPGESPRWSPTGNLYLLDIPSGKIEKLLEDTLAIVTAVADHPDVLVLYQFRVRDGAWTVRYNVHTRKDAGVEEPSGGLYYFDRKGIARIEVRLDGDAVQYAFRPTSGSRWRDLDDLVKQPGLHFNVRGPQLLDRVADVHSVGPDGDTLYISTRLNSDRFELAAFSMSEGVIKGVIAQHPRYDLTTADDGLARLLFDHRSTRLLGAIFEEQKPRVEWLDPDFAAVQKRIDQAFPDHINLPLDWSDDGSTFIYLSASDRDPGTYYVFQPGHGRLIPLLQMGEYLKGRTLSPMTPFEFTARDGRKIPAYVTRPNPPPSGPAPLIVYVHGGPMARDNWGFNPLVQFLASRGYIVLQVNYRGSSGYGAAFQNAGLRARLDTVVLDDIADGARSLIAQGEADPARVAVMGASFGGWAAYVSLAKYPDLYRAGVAISAISSWRAALRDDRWYYDNKIAYTFWKSLLSREDFSAEEPFIDPLRRADQIKQPVFIAHGGNDNIVRPTEAELMLNALKKHNPNVESRSFPFATHTDWRFEDRVVLFNEIALFLDRTLAPPAAPAGAAAR